MQKLSEFRDREAAQGIAQEIARVVEAGKLAAVEQIKIMEVCGGHTISIFKYGLQNLLPAKVKLLSGPGCPVCVTHNEYIDYAIGLSKQLDVIIATFGDLIRVPGSYSSLQKEKATGADIRICYSPTDALELARKNPAKKVIFLGIGFETTAPTIAAVVRRAAQEKLGNFLVLNAIKTMPNAMRALVASGELDLQGIICPGHVTAITGMHIYEFLAKEFKTPCVVSGFEPLDLLQSIYMIVKQLAEGRSEVENQYRRTTRTDGNKVAQALLDEVFEPHDSSWRGIGVIPGSGLVLRQQFKTLDARVQIPLQLEPVRENKACICGSIMRGVKSPHDCSLFAKACTPEDPKGSCMVSDEGTCATYFKYAR